MAKSLKKKSADGKLRMRVIEWLCIRPRSIKELQEYLRKKNTESEYSQNLINEMILEFKEDCNKRNAKKLFRIHWDGDFFSDEYAYAWKAVIEKHTDVQFWVYTRVPSAALILNNIDNLSLYFSTDKDNRDEAVQLNSGEGIRLAYLADTFAMGQADMKAMIGKVGAKCPENKKAIPLISTNGSACVSCSLCVYSKADIVFSATKK